MLAPLVELPGVADAAESARRAVDRLLTHQAMRRRGSEVAVEAGVRCARATAALEGDDTAFQGALRVSAEIGALVPVMERAPLQAVARIHLLAAAGSSPQDTLGRPRTEGDVGPRLAGLAQVVTATPAAVPAVVVAAVVHGELLSLAPFVSLNGVVARAAFRVVLVARGFDPRAVSAPEVGFAQDLPAYAAAAQGYADGSDIAGWLVHCARAAEHGAVEGIAICEALLRG